MKTYVVMPGHTVALGAGTVFQADPERVAGALRAGAIQEIDTPMPAQEQVQADEPEAQQAESVPNAAAPKAAF